MPREHKGRGIWGLPQPPVLSLLSDPRGFSSLFPFRLVWSQLSSQHTLHPTAGSSKCPTCGTISFFHCLSPAPISFTGWPQILV